MIGGILEQIVPIMHLLAALLIHSMVEGGTSTLTDPMVKFMVNGCVIMFVLMVIVGSSMMNKNKDE